MEIVFDVDFDSGAWPGPLASRDAAAGVAWLGPEGLLSATETQLGLRGPRVSAVRRVAQLAAEVARTEGFWSPSAQKDLLATARRLLSLRDELALSGWKGQGGTPLLDGLAKVTGAVQGGWADRLRACVERLTTTKASLDLTVLRSFTVPDPLPQGWRTLFDALGRAGTQVLVQPLPTVDATGDLSGARSAGFVPVGDGSLQLVRAQGVLQAADDLAAWLSTIPEQERRRTLVIGPDAVLDRALRAHGLPVLGAPEPLNDNPLLQILPLTLALASSPPDPQKALELLILPDSPVPGSLRFALARALHETPAVDSDAWRAVLREPPKVKDQPVDPETHARALERIQLLFHRGERGDRLPLAAVRERLRMLQTWSHARAADVEGGDLERWSGLHLQLSAFDALLDASGDGPLSFAHLKRLVEEATSGVPAQAPLDPQAGFSAVGSAGAVCGPAEVVVWWNFHRGAAGVPHRLPLSPEDVAALAKAGVVLPSASAQAVEASRRWNRPLALARSALVCVCPMHGADGEELFPHPLFDELLARVPAAEVPAAEGKLVRAQPASKSPVARVTPALLPLPEAVHDWAVVPGSIDRREVESPSGAASLLGCSLQWVLNYAARVRSGALGNLPSAEQVLGSTAHALLQTVLLEAKAAPGTISPEAAEHRVHALFDSEGPRLSAQLFQPGADGARAEVRRTTGQAARELFRLMQAGGYEVAHVEEPFSSNALGGAFEGRPDLVLRRASDGMHAVVDLKWSGVKYRRESLEHGSSHQLASYSHAVASAGGAAQASLPPNAFFILRSQRLLTADPSAFPEGQVVPGPGPDETWKAFEQGHAAAWKEVRAGRISAPGVALVDDAEDDSGIGEDGLMSLTPPCRFCDYAALCGKAFGVAAPEADATEGGAA